MALSMNRRRILFIANILGLVSVSTYCVSFFLPTFAIRIDGTLVVNGGFDAFIAGFFSFFNVFFGGPSVFMLWLANPVLWAGYYRFMKARDMEALLAGTIATCLSLTCFLSRDPAESDLILVGYYVWVLSIILFTLAATVKWATCGCPLPHIWDLSS
jgi:hypothetical protein